MCIQRFSSTVRFGNTPRPSGIVQTPERARASGRAPVTSTPIMWMCPPVGESWPLIAASVVVFPAPFGPSSPTMAPGGTTRSIPRSTSMRP